MKSVSKQFIATCLMIFAFLLAALYQMNYENNRRAGLGIMYQRKIKDGVYVGIAGDTNKSIYINIGVGF